MTDINQISGIIESAGPGLLTQLGAAAALVNAGATGPNFSSWENFPAPSIPTAQSTAIAQEALNGTLPANPVGGATTFANPNSPGGTPSIFKQGNAALSNLLSGGLDIGGTLFSNPMGGPASSLSALADGGSPGSIYAAQQQNGVTYVFQTTPAQDQAIASMFPSSSTMGDAWNSYLQANGTLNGDGSINVPEPGGYGTMTINPMQGSASTWNS
ncbi:MAG: hypothetical protein WBE80_10165 [Methylocella sp.]